MFLAALSITREGYFGGYGAHKADSSKPLKCTVKIIGETGTTELELPPETSEKLVALIAEELAASARKVAENMTAQFIAAAPTAKAIAGK